MSKLIDEKSRVFGKINIIDLLVIVVALAAVLYFGVKIITPKVATVTAQDELVIKLYGEFSPSYVVEAIKVGDKVEDEGLHIDFGTITDIETYDGYLLTSDAEGKQHKATVEGYNSYTITTEAKGQLIEDGAGGFKINGNTYVIGHGFTVRAGRTKLFLRLAGFEKKAAS